MTAHSKGRRPPPPLTESALQDMAIRYVGRFATTRAKLRSYLTRMYARPCAPRRIADIFRAMRSGEVSA